VFSGGWDKYPGGAVMEFYPHLLKKWLNVKILFLVQQVGHMDSAVSSINLHHHYSHEAAARDHVFY
jgi:hypothetical protein